MLSYKIFITSYPDAFCFPNKSIIVQGGVYIPTDILVKKMKPPYQRKFDAIFIGRLHQQKGVLTLVDIWHLVVARLPKSKLLIIGDGELANKLKTKIKILKLKKNITLTGFLIGPKKFNYIRQSKIIVHPATYDSGGMAAAEAMAWGLPGVAFDLESLQTYYPQGMIKTICFDQQIFANNIIKLLSDPSLYTTTSTSARELVKKKWRWSSRLETIYQALLARQ
jgi:glycosyltransferase involved in cell wall biosynthesis